MIRPAVLADVPRLVELGALMHAESGYRAQPYLQEKVATLLESLIQGGGVVFVFTQGDVVLGGMAGGITVNWFNDEVHAFEYALFLAPEARHGMAACKLVIAFDVWAKRRGAVRSRVGITTGVNVEGTARLYRAMGYQDGGVFLTKDF